MAGQADMIRDEAFLGVENSALGQRWVLRPYEARQALAISQSLGVDEIVGRILAGRGQTKETAAEYLEPRLRGLMPDPSSLFGMDAAVERITHAVTTAEKIGIFGDYDVDGATSSAILQRYFSGLGVESEIYIPDRMKEGYGPNGPALIGLKNRGAKLVLTVDCGAMAHKALGEARDAGLDVIVVDHHLAGDPIPVLAHINPNQPGDRSDLGHLAAAGVAFMVAVAVNRALRLAGWFSGDRPEPDITRLLDLVALGTVCDVVPLTGLNRAFVTQGLKVMAGGENIGLAALAQVARIKEALNTYHAGFLLGPRVNAGGRVGRAEAGAKLLTTSDESEARHLAEELDFFNEERKGIEAAVQEEAISQVEGQGLSDQPVIVVAGEGWHPGVIGIVAGRLKDRYRRPTFVLTQTDGVLKGSGRSVSGVDMGRAVGTLASEGLLISGGGHKMAAGLSLDPDQFAKFQDRLTELLNMEAGEARSTMALTLDGAISAGGAKAHLIDMLEKAGPYGAGNPAPHFALPGVQIAHSDIVGEHHIRCRINDGSGTSLKAVAFRAVDSPLASLLLRSPRGQKVHLTGRLKRDNWTGGNAVEFHITDAAKLA